MNKGLPEVTIEDLITHAHEIKGETLMLNGFLGKKPYVANNSIAPKYIPIYDAEGKEIEFRFDKLFTSRMGKLNLDLTANQAQEVHAEVSICSKCGEYRIHTLKVHSHNLHNTSDEHHTYRMG